MEADQQRIIDRIRKMLALANDAGATEPERAKALESAYKTLAKHNLEMAQVEAAGPLGQKEAERVIVKREFFGRPWARVCSRSIADMLFCLYLVTPGRTPKACVNWFIGRESNATSAAELAEYVTGSIWSEGSRKAKAAGGGNEWVRNFATAAAYEVQRRCAELKAAETKPALTGPPGNALVLASFYEKELAANQAIVNRMNVRTMQSHSKATHNFEAQAHGREFGKRVSLTTRNLLK